VTVLDAHVHLWDLAARPQPWTAQFPVLQRSFLLPELEKVLDDHGTDAAVVVQAGDTTGETLDLLALASTTPRLAGVVGWVDLDGPDVAGAAAALRRAPGGGKLVSVRHQLQVEPDPRYLARPGVRNGLPAGGGVPAPPPWPRPGSPMT
jgi:L-fuconolactonase